MKTDISFLRKQSHSILKLPEKAQKIVDGYLQLTVGGVSAACPYHINPGIRSTNRALLGKGSPAEIQAVATKYFKHYDMHTDDPRVLRSFLSSCGIGVDCSGFASWVLHAIMEEKLGKPIWKCLRFPGLRRNMVSKLRPIQNISANLLTGPTNATPLADLSQLKPGDLLRVAGWHHVVVIIEVGLDKSGKAQYFQYAQSSCMYEQASGVRTGYAIIKSPEGTLLEQQWFDGHAVSMIEQLIAEGGADSRAVRLKALS